jgi:hypothetical protein
MENIRGVLKALCVVWRGDLELMDICTTSSALESLDEDELRR